MRSLDLGRTFDATLIHDSISYMATESDLLAALRVAFRHTRPGGVALVSPDVMTETFYECTDLHEHDLGGRSLRCVEWIWRPDPSATTFRLDYAFLLREGDQVHTLTGHDLEGLFPRATWERLLSEAGFTWEVVQRPVPDPLYFDGVFVCRRPAPS